MILLTNFHIIKIKVSRLVFCFQKKSCICDQSERVSIRCPPGCLIDLQRKCILLEKSNSHYTHTHTFWSGRANPGALCSCVWQLLTLIVFGAFFCFPTKKKKSVGKISQQGKIMLRCQTSVSSISDSLYPALSMNRSHIILSCIVKIIMRKSSSPELQKMKKQILWDFYVVKKNYFLEI